MLFWNEALAAACGASLQEADLGWLCGMELPPHGAAWATAYAGHQFGHFVPVLGDGRALLLGDLRCGGERHELQLKGSGPTPFSRGGDGRAALGPMLREALIGEALHALGIPTTRALAVLGTGATVLREQGPLPGAVLARVASSHVRVGSFEFLAARGDREGLARLCRWTLARHHPQGLAQPVPARALLEHALASQASLIADWLAVGFVHGVMNTDNMALGGQSLDFGPCAFLDTYRAEQVFSSIDHRGRYAFARQPAVAQWNLARLAEALLPLLDPDPERALRWAQATIEGFGEQFERAWLERMGRKLGLARAGPEDGVLITEFLDLLQRGGHDYTLAFRSLLRRIDPATAWPDGLPDPTADASFADWLGRWRARLAKEGCSDEARLDALRSANPLLIPRNHRVEQALQAATEGDLGPFQRLLAAVRRPSELPAEPALLLPPRDHERVLQTFCGT